MPLKPTEVPELERRDLEANQEGCSKTPCVIEISTPKPKAQTNDFLVGLCRALPSQRGGKWSLLRAPCRHPSSRP